MAETKAAAELAFDAFIESYTPKYAKAADCLSKDRDSYWRSTTSRPRAETYRTTNPMKAPSPPCATHNPIEGCLSNRTALAMVFKLLEAAQKSWRRLDGHNQSPKLVLGVTFNDGIEVIAKPTTVNPQPARPSPKIGDSSLWLSECELSLSRMRVPWISSVSPPH